MSKPPIRGVSRSEGEPHDSLTAICNDLLGHMPEDRPELRCIVMVSDKKKSGIGVHGFDDDLDALVALFVHLRAMFNAQGKDLLLAPVAQERPQDQ